LLQWCAGRFKRSQCNNCLAHQNRVSCSSPSLSSRYTHSVVIDEQIEHSLHLPQTNQNQCKSSSQAGGAILPRRQTRAPNGERRWRGVSGRPRHTSTLATVVGGHEATRPLSFRPTPPPRPLIETSSRLNTTAETVFAAWPSTVAFSCGAAESGHCCCLQRRDQPSPEEGRNLCRPPRRPSHSESPSSSPPHQTPPFTEGRGFRLGRRAAMEYQAMHREGAQQTTRFVFLPAAPDGSAPLVSCLARQAITEMRPLSCLAKR